MVVREIYPEPEKRSPNRFVTNLFLNSTKIAILILSWFVDKKLFFILSVFRNYYFVHKNKLILNHWAA